MLFNELSQQHTVNVPAKQKMLSFFPVSLHIHCRELSEHNLCALNELRTSWGLNSINPSLVTSHIQCLNSRWTNVSWTIPALVIRELNNWNIILHHILCMLVWLLNCLKHFYLRKMAKCRPLSHYQPALSSNQVISTTWKLISHSNSLQHFYTFFH